jgi:hypothetical protein
MPNGYSLHIGLNQVDPAAYHGWSGALSGCINDANAMQRICQAQGFETHLLTDAQATASAVLGALSDIASRAAMGDTVVVSYSGHGGQVPDAADAGEIDGLSETWVCFDRMLIDNELRSQWSAFPAGAHVQVYSDSCHSGTVIRELRLEDFPGFDAGISVTPQKRDALGHLVSALQPPRPGARSAPLPAVLAAVSAVLAPAARTNDSARSTREAVAAAVYKRSAAAAGAAHAAMLPRAIPASLAITLWREKKAFYTRQLRPGPILCGVTLISGCQDNQLSADGTSNGLFTEKLLQVWANGAFNGTLVQFHAAICQLMPPDQTPNYDLTGADDDLMAQSKPLTIIASETPSIVAPRITAPADYDCTQDTPPEFTVEAGAGRNYIVELATDPTLFGQPAAQRAQSTAFYGSWQDSPRQTAPRYRPPQSVWQRLRQATRLYYRTGSTTSPAPAWDNYLVSTRDQDAASAPSIRLAAVPAPEAGWPAPTIAGPANFARSEQSGPTFSIDAGPYFAVEVCTDSTLFAGGTRTPSNFFASWEGPDTRPLLQGSSYTLPAAAWGRLRQASSLYYRVLSTSSANGWDDFRMSVTQENAAKAPFIGIVGGGGKDASDFDDADQLGYYLLDQRASDMDMLSSRDDAHDIVAAFRASDAAGPWVSLDRATVADRLDELIDYPRGMRQGGMNVCGPAAFFMMALARDPAGVARCATDLFDTGSGQMQELVITPRDDMLQADYAAMGQEGDVSSQLEWMLLGALRNSTSVFWQSSWTGDPQQEFAGMTRPEELAEWMRWSGLWAQVTDGGKWAANAGIPNAMNLLPPVGRDHALLINTTMIAKGNVLAGVRPDPGFLTSQFPNHWLVLLAEPIMDPAETTVSLSIWSWGENLRLDVPARDFLDNYYGAVSGVFAPEPTRRETQRPRMAEQVP